VPLSCNQRGATTLANIERTAGDEPLTSALLDAEMSSRQKHEPAAAFVRSRIEHRVFVFTQSLHGKWVTDPGSRLHAPSYVSACRYEMQAVADFRLKAEATGSRITKTGDADVVRQGLARPSRTVMRWQAQELWLSARIGTLHFGDQHQTLQTRAPTQ